MNVICADCGIETQALIECITTKQEGHDGIWAHCPRCGITGIE